MANPPDPMAQIEAALANVLSAAMRYARVHHDIGNTRMIEASEKELEMERESLLALIRSALAAQPGQGEPDLRDFLGQIVRMVWVEWAKEQLNPKPSWLLPWSDLSEPDREVDRRIGERLYRMGVDGLYATPPTPTPDEAGVRAMFFRDTPINGWVKQSDIYLAGYRAALLGERT